MEPTAIPITVGGEHFPAKIRVEEVVQLIINHNRWRTNLPEMEFNFIENLYLRHPMSKNLPPIWDIQIIPGCNKCERRNAGACFLMKCSDGSKFCFAHQHALYPVPGAELLRTACRAAIWKQIYRKKRALQDRFSGMLTCTIEHKPIKWDETEIDHAAPGTLEQLVWDWLWEKGLYIDSVKLGTTFFRGRRKYFIKEKSLVNSWRLFHCHRARVRPLCKSAHRRVSQLWYEKREVIKTETWSIKQNQALGKPLTKKQRVRRGFIKHQH